MGEEDWEIARKNVCSRTTTCQAYSRYVKYTSENKKKTSGFLCLFCGFVFVIVSESAFPMNVALAVAHSIFVKGDITNFEIESSFGIEASELYSDVKYTCVDEYFDKFV